MKVTVYHGSPYKFTSFDKEQLGHATTKFDDENNSSKLGFFFTDDIEYAKGYAINNGFLYTCELTINNPLEIDLDEYMATDAVVTNFIKQAKENGNDGVIFKNIRELGRPKATEYVVFNTNKIKILDTMAESLNSFAVLNSLLEGLL